MVCTNNNGFKTILSIITDLLCVVVLTITRTVMKIAITDMSQGALLFFHSHLFARGILEIIIIITNYSLRRSLAFVSIAIFTTTASCRHRFIRPCKVLRTYAYKGIFQWICHSIEFSAVDRDYEVQHGATLSPNEVQKTQNFTYRVVVNPSRGAK